MTMGIYQMILISSIIWWAVMLQWTISIMEIPF